MPVTTQGGKPKILLTIAQVFAQKNLWKWWEQNGGKGTNLFDGVSEKGMDYSTTFGTPIGVPVGGTIVRIVHHTSAINDIVELEADDGSVWLYQHITAGVKVKQKLGVGGVIGTENGLPVDQYSTGPHIEVRYCQPGRWNPAIDSWIEPWVNPYLLFSGLSDLPAGAIDTGSVFNTLIQQLQGNNPLAPNANVAQVLYGLDQLGTINNPFDTSKDNVAQDSILGATFDDPISWLGAFGTNLVSDTQAIAFRLFLLLVGAIIIYKALSHFIAIDKIAGAGLNLGKLAALGGV